MFNRSWHAATRSSIFSRVSGCGTNLEHSFCSFKSSLKIRRITVFGMPSVSAINRDVKFRSSMTILSTAAMLSSFDLWADHCVRRPSLILYPLATVCATQKLLFDLMLYHPKPSESVPVFVAEKSTLQQNLIATLTVVVTLRQCREMNISRH